MAPLNAPVLQGFDYFIGQINQGLCHNMYPRAIDFIGNRKIDMRDVVTHKFALADFKEAFAVMERGDKSLKVVLEP